MNKFPLTSGLTLITLLSCFFSQNCLALPDDKLQEGFIDGKSGGLLLKDGITILTLYGEEDELAVFTQGSLKISGTEMVVEKAGEVLQKITVTGQPARFQQQPGVDQQIIYARGQTVVFNNTTQILSVDQDAELIQDGSTFNGHHIDYDIESGNINADSDDDGLIRIVIPAAPK